MSIEKNFFFFISLFIVFLPFFLIKPATADIACVLVGFSYLIYCFFKKNFSYFKNYYIYFFLIIFFYINLNSYFSFNPSISYHVSLSYFRIILFIVSLSFFFKENKNLKLYFYYSFLVCISILLIDSIIQIYFGRDIIGYLPGEDGQRINSFFGKKLIMGSFVTRLLPLFLGVGFLLNFKKLNLAILFISAILVILSAERVAFAYLVITIIVYLYFTFDLKRSFYLAFIFLMLFASLFFFFPKNFNRLFNHTFYQLKQNNNILGLSYRHQLHFLTAYNMFLDKKIIGHGLIAFRYLCSNSKYTVEQKIIDDNLTLSPTNGKLIYHNDINSDGTPIVNIQILNDNSEIIYQEKKKVNFIKFFSKNNEYIKRGQKLFAVYEYKNGCNTHPHNIYLQFLSELGIIGCFLFLIIFVYSSYCLFILVVKSFKKKLNNVEHCLALVILCVITSMFPIFPSGNYFNNWLLVISYLPIGFYLSLANDKNV
jgi:O-antigen ligase